MGTNRLTLTFFSLILSFLIPFYSIAQIAAVMPGTYDVNSSGGFVYALPLRIPPGIKSLVPNLAVSYSSQGGNGTMGVGWSVTGLSSITRGGQTIYHDRDIAPVDYNNDVLFLDGQRLFEDTTNIYFTEVKNFARIQYHSGSNNFSVTYPNGTRYKYGQSANSKMFGKGRSDVYMWALTSIDDVHGNYIEFDYDNDSSTGEYRINKITYGLNSNTTDDKLVEILFNYNTSRSDVNKTWIDGSEVLFNALLADITIKFSDASQANKYAFTYDVNNLSRLTKIEELTNGTATLPPININWGSTATTPDTTILSIATGNRVLSAGDFNGDGYSDFAGFNRTGSPSVDVFLNNKNGGFNSGISISSPMTSGDNNSVKNAQLGGTKFTFDYDGDGMDDMIVMNSDGSGNTHYFNLWLYRANGTTTGSYPVFDSPVPIHFATHTASGGVNVNFASLTRITAGDYDGDGKTELIVAQPYTFHNSNSVSDYEVFVVGDEYGDWKIDHFSYGHIDGALTMDYNGDGRDEYIFNHRVSGTTPSSLVYELKLSYDYTTMKPQLIQTSTTWPVNFLCSSSFPHSEQKHWPGDYNGDGKTDFIVWDTNWEIWAMAYSDGDYTTYTTHPSFAVPAPLSTYLNSDGPNHIGNGDYAYYAADFNGDGMTDFLQLERTSTRGVSNYDVFYSTGTSFVHEDGVIGIDPEEVHMAIGDFNGDAQADLLSGYNVNTSDMTLATFQKDNRTLMVTSIEHAGKTIDIEYSTLAQDSDYTPYTNTADEYQIRTLPIKIVKSISDNSGVDNTYYYSGLVLHKYGLGMRGFKEFIMENTAGQKTYQRFNLESRIPYLSEAQIFDTYDGMPFAKKSTYKQHDIYGGANGHSRIILHYADTTIDYVNAEKVYNKTITGSTSTSSILYKFGPVDSTIIIRTDLNGNPIAKSIRTNRYSTGWLANKGKPDTTIVYNDLDASGANGITNITSYTYYTNGDLETQNVNPGTDNEKLTTFTYDSIYGNLIQTELNPADPPGSGTVLPDIITEYGYTSDGKFKQRTIDPEGYTFKCGFGNLDASWGNVLIDTNQQGLVNSYVYDQINRKIKSLAHGFLEYNLSTTTADTLETYTTYSWASSSSYIAGLNNPQLLMMNTTNDNQSFSGVITDINGREIRKIKNDFGGNSIYLDKEYSNTGLLIATTSPYRATNPLSKVVTSRYYDPYDRLYYSMTDQGGPEVATTYDISSGLLNVTGTNIITSTTRSSVKCGDILFQINGPSESINYSYYGNGMPHTIITNGDTVTNTLDNWGRIIANSQPNAGTFTKEYDALDRITKETAGTGVVYEFQYDKIGRVLEKKEVGASVGYTASYHPAGTGLGQDGQLYQETSPNGYSTSYTYGANGLLTNKVEAHLKTFATSYSYYPNGKLWRYLFPRDITLQYGYNSSGEVDSIGTAMCTRVDMQTLWLITGRDPYGQLGSAYILDDNNSVAYGLSKTYDVHGYPIDISVHNSWVSNKIVNFKYGYNPANGNMMYRLDTIRSFREEFEYDQEFDRLTKVNYINPASLNSLEISYATNGNILKKTDVSNSTAYPQDWKYDKYALTKVPDPASVSFEIPQNQLDDEYYSSQKIKKIREDLKNEVRYVNGPNDQRVAAQYYDISNPALTPKLKYTKYYAQNFELIEDPVTMKQTEIYYAWAGEQLISVFKVEVDSSLMIPIISSNIYQVVTDPLGSITHLLSDTNSNGIAGNGIMEERSYDAWGRLRDPNSWAVYSNGTFPISWITDRGYTGHEHVIHQTSTLAWQNNIINMDGRLYDPLIGRMFSPDNYIPDQQNSQDFNKYSYARNNPLKYNDPDGNWVLQVVVGGGIGGYLGYKYAESRGYNTTGKIIYTTGGVMIGAASGLIGAQFVGGGLMSNSLGIIASSAAFSGGMYVMTGGATDFTVSYGVGSYNFSSGKHGFLYDWLWDNDGENTWQQNVGYLFGAMANVQDIIAGVNGVNAQFRAEAGGVLHARLDGSYNNKYFDISVSHYPMEDGFYSYNLNPGEPGYSAFKDNISYAKAWGKHIDKGRYYFEASPGSRLFLNNVNGKWLSKMYDRITKGNGLFGFGKLKYGTTLFGCQSHVAHALWGVGIPTLPINFMPQILLGQLYIRQVGIYASPFLINR